MYIDDDSVVTIISPASKCQRLDYLNLDGDVATDTEQEGTSKKKNSPQRGSDSLENSPNVILN